MEQQFILGQKLRDKYVKTGFLQNFYDSQQVCDTKHWNFLYGHQYMQQIFIRSTDVNRTINSAISNMLGMFSSSVSRPGRFFVYAQVPRILVGRHSSVG